MRTFTAAVGAGDDGFASDPPDAEPPGAGADEGEGAAVTGAPVADGVGVPVRPPLPGPAAWAVQPVATSATAAVASTALRMTDERFMVAPRELDCAHRDASRPPAVARPAGRSADVVRKVPAC
ncbi:hypothetical protein GCM10010282_33030 [Streptomyces roseolus]|nr:hypothetical protein GCM10010282_33030 [Streptomyces roseolus]